MGISVCQRTRTVAHIGGRRAGPMCPAAQGDTDSPCLPLRGRWQREALAEGEIPHGFLSPSRLCRQPPPRGASQRGTAALTGRRTPRAFVPLRSTAGRRPLRPMCGCTRLSFRRGRCPHRPAGINAHSAAGHMGPALQGACVRADRVDEPARSQISEGGFV